MDNSSDTVLTKRVAHRLEIICRFGPSGRHLHLLHNKNTSADAESREEQEKSISL